MGERHGDSSACARRVGVRAITATASAVLCCALLLSMLSERTLPAEAQRTERGHALGLARGLLEASLGALLRHTPLCADAGRSALVDGLEACTGREWVLRPVAAPALFTRLVWRTCISGLLLTGT